MLTYKVGQQLKLDLKERGAATLFLKQDGHHGISLMATHGGRNWFILSIDEDKPIKLHSSLPKDFIIPVDEYGIPIIQNEGGHEYKS